VSTGGFICLGTVCCPFFCRWLPLYFILCRAPTADQAGWCRRYCVAWRWVQTGEGAGYWFALPWLVCRPKIVFVLCRLQNLALRRPLPSLLKQESLRRAAKGTAVGGVFHKASLPVRGAWRLDRGSAFLAGLRVLGAVFLIAVRLLPGFLVGRLVFTIFEVNHLM